MGHFEPTSLAFVPEDFKHRSAVARQKSYAFAAIY
jgi:hypothetical protein